MASVFLYHVVGDLTVGKPELVEFLETETVEAAIRAIGESMEGGIPVWRKRSLKSGVMGVENAEMRQQRFVGILNSLDLVAFLARKECLEDQEKAMRTLVSDVVVRNGSLLKEVDPATRLVALPFWILVLVTVWVNGYRHQACLIDGLFLGWIEKDGIKDGDRGTSEIHGIIDGIV